jgi:mRNA-degrading endonuclease toxin of MazEF toxin-antitoxin module
VICEQWDLVVVPFPFTDVAGAKRRPALVLSAAGFNKAAGHAILAMITTARHSSWPGDIPLTSAATGLPKDCVVRLKLFTLDNRLIERLISKLPAKERSRVRTSLEMALGVSAT